MRLDVNSYVPSAAQFVLIGIFIVGALALIPQYVTLSPQVTGYLFLAAALITLALKVFTVEPETPPQVE